MEKVIPALLYGSYMLILYYTIPALYSPLSVEMGEGGMQSALVPVRVLSFLLGKKSVGAYRKEMFLWCLYTCNEHRDGYWF